MLQYNTIRKSTYLTNEFQFEFWRFSYHSFFLKLHVCQIIFFHETKYLSSRYQVLPALNDNDRFYDVRS